MKNIFNKEIISRFSLNFDLVLSESICMKNNLFFSRKIVLILIIAFLFVFFSFSTINLIVKPNQIQNNISISNLYLTQPIIQRQETPKIILRFSENYTYKVQKNDTLYSIAKKYNITVEELKKANNLKDSDIIKIGMNLIIPVQSFNVYSPVDLFDYKLKTEKILLIYSKSSIIFSPLNSAEIVFLGNISGFGKSVILKSQDYNIVISNLEEIFVQVGQKVNLQTCLGFCPSDNVLNLSVFLKDKMLSLGKFLAK